MIAKIVVPKLSATMEEATVLQWLKQPGDKVTSGEAVIELETDKAAIEVEATKGGFLSAHLVAESQVVPVGTVLAHILEHVGMPVPGLEQSGPPAGAALKPTAAVPGAERQVSRQSGVRRRVRVSPRAKRLADELGIELSGVRGSGSDGEISQEDVLAAARGGNGAEVPDQAMRSRHAVSPMRRRIAEQVARSNATIPQYFVEVTVDTRAICAVRTQLNSIQPASSQARISYTDFLLQGIADTAARYPEFGMVWQDGSPPALIEAGISSLGLIVSLEEGLLIPVLTDVDRLSLTDLARKRVEAVNAARTNRVGSRFMAPCAISLSNLGATGVDRFQAIVEPGQTAVLAAGSERAASVVENGQVVAATVMTLVLSVDHRVIDGAVAGRFIANLRKRMESGTWR